MPSFPTASRADLPDLNFKLIFFFIFFATHLLIREGETTKYASYIPNIAAAKPGLLKNHVADGLAGKIILPGSSIMTQRRVDFGI